LGKSRMFVLLMNGMQKSDGLKATGKQNLFLFCS